MFEKTRLRIFALIMGAASVIILLMLSVIYGANLYGSYERSLSLLERYTESGFSGPPPEPVPESVPGPEKPGMRPGMREEHNRLFRLSTFYSVFYDPQGEAVRVNSGGGVLYTEQEILEIAGTVLSGGRNRGICRGMPFLVKNVAGGRVVALIDHTMESDQSGRLFAYSCWAGAAGWLLVLLLAWFFSGRIVAPLAENDRRQRQFISDAGHELKTPVSVISANADLLSAELGDNRWLANIRYENQRMGDLVKQLLELARAETARQTREQLDLSRLVSGEALPFESVAFENGQQLQLEVQEGISVNGDSSGLRQLTAILIDNAIRHGEAGKEIRVRLYAARHTAVLSVINAGPPIPEEDRSRLFERFYRADAARSGQSGHYGLGLAIARAIAVAHGGRIELDCRDGLIEFRAILPRS